MKKNTFKLIDLVTDQEIAEVSIFDLLHFKVYDSDGKDLGFLFHWKIRSNPYKCFKESFN
jgi:hypothetical protein